MAGYRSQADSLPSPIAALAGEDFQVDYFFFVTNTIGAKRISLFAVGSMR